MRKISFLLISLFCFYDISFAAIKQIQPITLPQVYIDKPRTYNDAFVNPRLNEINANFVDIQSGLTSKENTLGNPAQNGSCLQSSVGGNRSWGPCGISQAASDGSYYGSKNGSWTNISNVFQPLNSNLSTAASVSGNKKYYGTNSSGVVGVYDLPTGGGGDITYPETGVVTSTGSAFGSSLPVGTGANNLVKLDGSAKLPAVSGANLTGTFTGTTLSAATTMQSAIQALGTVYDSGINVVAGTGITIAESSGTATIGVTPNTYQPVLASGTNIKTINGASLLGSGNLTVSGGGTSIPQVASDLLAPQTGDMWINTTDHSFNWAEAGGVAKVTSTFSAWDIAPNAFTFTDEADVAVNTAKVSNAITVAGITHASPISVTGDTGYGYKIGSGSCVTSSGTVVLGDTVSACVTSSASNSTATSATVTIGGVSDTYSVTTIAGATGETINPTSALLSSWSKQGSAASNIASITDSDDTTYLQSAASSASIAMQMQATTAPTISGVKLCARVKVDSSGTQNSRFRLHDGTSYQSFPPDPLNVSSTTWSDVCTSEMTTNPYTSTPWTSSALNTMSWYIVSNNSSSTPYLQVSKAWAVVRY
jgi:hypothetical protein